MKNKPKLTRCTSFKMESSKICVACNKQKKLYYLKDDTGVCFHCTKDNDYKARCFTKMRNGHNKYFNQQKTRT